jgi:hypothetical protein
MAYEVMAANNADKATLRGFLVGSNLSPEAQLGYRVLVHHVNRRRDSRAARSG